MLDAFEFISQTDSSLYGSYFYLSLLNKKTGNNNKYIDYMNKYIQYSDNNEKAHYLKAMYHFDQQEYIESLFILQQILINNKNSLLARIMTAECLFELGSFINAIEAFKIVLINDPYHVKSRYNLGICYMQSSQYNKAIDELTLDDIKNIVDQIYEAAYNNERKLNIDMDE